MEASVVETLHKLNSDFYDTVVASFDLSRAYPWKGWGKIALRLKSSGKRQKVLDLGCGNGRFIKFLQQKSLNVEYTGIDRSKGLISLAKERYEGRGVSFVEMDFLNEKLPWRGEYDLVVSFGVFHHLPGEASRVKLLKEIYKVLRSGGEFIVTFWRFANDLSIKSKVYDWEEINIEPKDVDENDYLLGWSGEKGVYRYCHHYTPSEAVKLMEKVGFRVVTRYVSDGKSGDLNLYLICKK